MKTKKTALSLFFGILSFLPIASTTAGVPGSVIDEDASATPVPKATVSGDMVIIDDDLADSDSAGNLAVDGVSNLIGGLFVEGMEIKPLFLRPSADSNKWRFVRYDNQVLQPAAPTSNSQFHYRNMMLLVIDRSDGHVISYDGYDTYLNDSIRDALATELNALDSSVIVAVIASQAWRIDGNSNLTEALYRIGASPEAMNHQGGTHNNKPYALVGIPGIGMGNGIEVFNDVDVELQNTGEEVYHLELATLLVRPDSSSLFTPIGLNNNDFLRNNGDAIFHGKVGIGTDTPNAALQIGDGTPDASNILVLGETETATNGSFPRIHQLSSDGAGQDLALGASSASGKIRFFTGAITSGNDNLLGSGDSSEKMTILPDGKIGINTTTPSTALEVNGNLTVTGSITSNNSPVIVSQPSNAQLTNGGLSTDGGDSGIYSDANDTVSIATAGVERFSINTTGNIGIGKSSPVEKLDVGGYIRAEHSAGDFIYMGHGGSNAFISAHGTGSLDFRIDDATRMTLDDQGDLGIGITQPAKKIHVYETTDNSETIRVQNTSNGASAAATVYFQNNSGSNGLIGLFGSDFNNVDLQNSMYIKNQADGNLLMVAPADKRIGLGLGISGSDANDLNITGTGNVGIGTATPSSKLHVVGDLKVEGRIIGDSEPVAGSGSRRYTNSLNLPSAAGLSLNKEHPFWLKIMDALHPEAYAGVPERFEIEITGPGAEDYNRDIYQVQSRGGLAIYKRSENGGLPTVHLEIYDDTTVANDNNDTEKFHIVLYCDNGSGWHSLSVRVRDLNKGSWVPIEYSTTDPVIGFADVTPDLTWISSDIGNTNINGDLKVSGKLLANEIIGHQKYNYIRNGDFEGDFTEHLLGAYITTEDSKSGNQSLVVGDTGFIQWSELWNQEAQKSFPRLEEGKTYTLSFWAKNTTSTDISYGYEGCGGYFLRSIPANSGWTRYSRTQTISSACSAYTDPSMMQIRTHVASWNGGKVYFDDIVLTEGTSTVDGMQHPMDFFDLSGSSLITSQNDSVYFNNDADTKIHSDALDSVSITTGGVERVHVDDLGNVGIGTNNPTGMLSIDAGGSSGIGAPSTPTFSNASIHVTDDIGNVLAIDSNQIVGRADDLAIQNSKNGGKVHISAGGSDSRHFTVLQDGNIGIGTDDPQQKLHISEGVVRIDRNGSALFIDPNDGNNNEYAQMHATSGMGLKLTVNDSNDALLINSDGNVGIGTDTQTSAAHLALNDATGVKDSFTITSGANVNATLPANGAVKIDLQAKNAADTNVAEASIQVTRDTETGMSTNATELSISTKKTDGTTDERMRIDGNGDAHFSGKIFMAAPAGDIPMFVSQ